VWVVIVLALFASISSISNGFALDDVHIIVQNARVHDIRNVLDVFSQSYWPADRGGALYRPLTSLFFTVEWAIGNGSPLPFHAVSIATYCAVSSVVFLLAREFVRWEAALLAGSLFAVHPVHVEAVANVVGQAELFAGLCAIAAVTLFIRGRRRGNVSRRDVTVVTALYAAGLLFKEHVVVLPALLVAAEMILLDSEHRRNIIAACVPMTAVAVLFVVVRSLVLGEVAGAGVSPVFVNTGYSARVYTMLVVMMEWVRLFVWPAHLASDYAPLVSVATSFSVAMIPSLLVIAGLSGIGFTVRKTAPGVAFGLAFTGVTLLIPSNLIVMTGFVVAERALFLPSVGVVIAVAAGIEGLIQHVAVRNPRITTNAAILAALLLVLGVARSTDRNAAWKDNASLIEHNVEDLPASWQAHMMMAQLHNERGRGPQALQETEIALRLGDRNDYHLLAFAADMYQMYGRCDKAMPYYSRSLAIAPDQPQVKTNADLCAARKVAEAR
jgi:hypothetical protein